MPVINLGPGVNLDALTEQGGHLDGIITVDFENQGKMVAEDMLKQMPEGGKVAIIQGMPGGLAKVKAVLREQRKFLKIQMELNW